MDISIIIPTYNRLWSLPKAVSSCYDPDVAIEVIVIDDGSTDDTWQWLKQQDNVIAIKQENMGKDWAVNKGFSIATGKYIRFLDSDDWILPGSCAKLFHEAEKTGADIICGGYETYDENEKLIKETPWTVCDDFLAQQLGECDSSHYSAYLFKKDFINNIPHRQEFGGLDDRQFIIETALKYPKTSYISSPALAHRIHNNIRLQNISGLQKTVYHQAYYNIYKKALTLLEARGELNQRRKNAACNNLWHLAHWTAYSDITAAYKIYQWVYKLNPQFKPTGNKPLALLYKTLGFTFTERLLKLKRG
ncbi:MAG: glycosyltransferase family 2 protein [Mucilaginibacter sp.]|nr:glycosyltransferase family 2 protein [Mucilaginibacter sp.]